MEYGLEVDLKKFLCTFYSRSVKKTECKAFYLWIEVLLHYVETDKQTNKTTTDTQRDM